MRWWNSLSLMSKLFMPQLIVIAVCGIVIYTANMGFQDAETRMDRITENDMPRVIFLMEAQGDFAFIATAQKEVLLAPDDKTLDIKKGVFDKRASDAQKRSDETQNMLKNPERKKIMAEGQKALKEYIDYCQKLNAMKGTPQG